MARPVHLALEDGSVFTGESFGAQRDGWGEVVFNTTMTGYQEVLTDPSYAGQMVAVDLPIGGQLRHQPERFRVAPYPGCRPPSCASTATCPATPPAT